MQLGERLIRFAKGERLSRAIAYKYTPTDFERIASDAGWQLRRSFAAKLDGRTGMVQRAILQSHRVTVITGT
ncbi:MAG: L-histidine N(alpha)-methyltransferase [Anaerolineales bacterium]